MIHPPILFGLVEPAASLVEQVCLIGGQVELKLEEKGRSSAIGNK